jgi:hypothetical protein
MTPTPPFKADDLPVLSTGPGDLRGCAAGERIRVSEGTLPPAGGHPAPRQVALSHCAAGWYRRHAPTGRPPEIEACHSAHDEQLWRTPLGEFDKAGFAEFHAVHVPVWAVVIRTGEVVKREFWCSACLPDAYRPLVTS